jgi:hypothetical protein
MDDAAIYETKKKVKQSHYRPEQAQRVGRGIALIFRDLGARRGWVVSLTPRPRYPRERPGTHFRKHKDCVFIIQLSLPY